MAEKDEQEQHPEEVEPVNPMVAAAANLAAMYESMAQGGTYGSMEPQAQVFGPVGGMQPAGGPVPVGGPTKGPGMTQGGMMYDPTTGQYTSSTAIQDLVTEEQKP